jgi:hypothetical protein
MRKAKKSAWHHFRQFKAATQKHGPIKIIAKTEVALTLEFVTHVISDTW